MKIIETKVLAAMIGGGGGAALSTFLLWLLGVVFWGASSAAGDAATAIASVPQPVSGLIVILLSAGLAAVGGYAAPHTSRPDLTPVP